MTREDVLRELDTFDEQRLARRPGPPPGGTGERGAFETGRRELPRREELARDQPPPDGPETTSEETRRASERLPPEPSEEPVPRSIGVREFFEALKTAPEIPPDIRERAQRTVDELVAEVANAQSATVDSILEVQRIDRIITLLEGVCGVKENLEAVRVANFSLESSPPEENINRQRDILDAFFALRRVCDDLRQLQARRRDFIESAESQARNAFAMLSRVLDIRLGKVEAITPRRTEEP
jgi:hypothetical protein